MTDWNNCILRVSELSLIKPTGDNTANVLPFEFTNYRSVLDLPLLIPAGLFTGCRNFFPVFEFFPLNYLHIQLCGHYNEGWMKDGSQ